MRAWWRSVQSSLSSLRNCRTAALRWSVRCCSGTPPSCQSAFSIPSRGSLKRFAEAQADRFCVGVGEHEVIDHVREGFSCNGHAQILHMGEIRLCSLAGLVPLLKDHFLLWSMHGPPSSDMSL